MITIVKKEIENRMPILADLRIYAKNLHDGRFPDQKIAAWIEKEIAMIANESIYKAKEGCLLYDDADEIKTKCLGVKNLKITNVERRGFCLIFILEGVKNNIPVRVSLYDHDLFIALKVFIDNWLTKYITEGKHEFTFYHNTNQLFVYNGSPDDFIKENIGNLI